MRGKLTPGQRARLAAMGLSPADAGKMLNRANLTGAVDLKNVTIPKSSDELAEMLADRKRLGELVNGGTANLHAFIDQYAKEQQAPGTPLHKEVESQTFSEEFQQKLVAWLRENETPAMRRLNLGNLDPQWNAQTAMQRKYATGYNPEAPGAALDSQFKNAGEFFRNVWMYKHAPNRMSDDVRAKMINILNTYTEMVPADGGFLVPEALRSELLRVSLESGITRSRARVIPMETLRVAFPMIDSTTNDGSIHGGMIAYWTQEAAALTQSQATFGQIVLEAFKLTGLSKVSNELLADSMISFTALIEQLWPEVLAFFEDLAFIGGTGAGEPLGWLSNAASLSVTKETGQTASTIVWENVIKMYARMLPSSLNRAVWVASPDAFPELATMALTVGTGGSAVWLNNGAGGPPATILGRPLIISEKMNTLGTRGDIAFVDLGYYLIGDRQTMSLATSTHSDFENDMTAFRIIQRVTGRPWLQSAITPANGGSTLSPFVELETRA